jgi:hypothetical protein
MIDCRSISRIECDVAPLAMAETELQMKGTDGKPAPSVVDADNWVLQRYGIEVMGTVDLWGKFVFETRVVD